MPTVILHRSGATHEGQVADNTNLVVRAGIKQFPHPHLRYGCGMGKCSRCACRVIAGAEHLPPPNWKEQRQLGDWLDKGYRLPCQLWVTHDIELAQDEQPPPLPAGSAPAGSALGVRRPLGGALGARGAGTGGAVASGGGASGSGAVGSSAVGSSAVGSSAASSSAVGPGTSAAPDAGTGTVPPAEPPCS